MLKARTSWTGAFLAAAVAVTLTATAAPGQAAGKSEGKGRAHAETKLSPQVLASNLKNPRDAQVKADGTILVAEAGTGPATACAPGTECLGFTGSVYRIKGSQQGRVVTGLASKMEVTADGRSSIAGANEVEQLADGSYRLITALSGTNDSRSALGPGSETLGTMHLANGRVLGDLTDHESRLDPDSVLGNNEVLSNAWKSAKDGADYLVTDASANDLIRVLPDGTTRTEAVFPNNGTHEAVPTGIARGADGAFYIADMSALTTGAGRIWRYVPGGEPTVFATGLTNVIDLAVDPRGNLIALSLNKGYTETGPLPGALTRIDKTTGQLTEIPTGDRLNNATGLTVGAGGEFYVTNNGLGTSGELLKFPAA